MTKFNLKIITPKGIYKEVEVDQVNVRTTSGQIGILGHHMPLASALEIGDMNYIIDGKKTYFALAGGFIYVGETETTIITNAIESQDEIDLDRATKAKDRAEKRIKQHEDNTDLLRAEIALKRAITRINVKNIS